MFFECTVRYERAGENGLFTRTTESYLVDAMSFTEAEATVTGTVTQLVSVAGDFEVTAIKRSNISAAISNPAGDVCTAKLFKIKAVFYTLNEQTGKQTKSAQYYIIQDKSIEEANKHTEDYLRSTLIDYSIATIDESKFIAIINHA